MHDDHHDANPGGLERQEGQGPEKEKRPRKPLFSTSYNPRADSEKREQEDTSNGSGGNSRKRPPRKRISISPAEKSPGSYNQPRPSEDGRDRYTDYASMPRRESFAGYGSPEYTPEAQRGAFPRNKPKRQPGKPFPKGGKPRPGGARTGAKPPTGKTGANPGKPGARYQPGKGPGRGDANRSSRPFFPRAPYIPTILEGPVRLNKYIASAGICSRRDADRLIEAGEIRINGQVVDTLGARVNPGDTVTYNDRTLKSEPKYYILLNKPKGYVTTMDDPEDRETVMELVKNACRERIFPVGRLDRNTTGLLLLTNDGELAKKMTHPTHRVRKIYHVELDRPLNKADMMHIAAGIRLEDGLAEVDAIAYVGTGDDRKQVGIELHTGKNRIVRRIFETLNYHVQKLDRVSFGSLTKKNLPRGRWRYLTQHEVNFLKMI